MFTFMTYAHHVCRRKRHRSQDAENVRLFATLENVGQFMRAEVDAINSNDDVSRLEIGVISCSTFDKACDAIEIREVNAKATNTRCELHLKELQRLSPELLGRDTSERPQNHRILALKDDVVLSVLRDGVSALVVFVGTKDIRGEMLALIGEYRVL